MTITEKLQRLTDMISISRLARKTDVNRQALGNAIKGKQRLTIESSVRIAKVLGIDPGWLIDDARDWPPAYIAQRQESVAETAAA